MMRISSADNYLQVEPREMYGEWKTVWISAPSSDAAPPAIRRRFGCLS